MVIHMLVYHGLHNALDLAVSELGLGLSLELWVEQLHVDHRGEALTYIVADEGYLVLDARHSFDEIVYGAGKARFKPDEMRSALDGVYVVDKGEDIFVKSHVVLNGYLHLYVIALFLKVDGFPVKRGFGPVYIFDKGFDAAVELKGVFLFIPAVPAVLDDDADSLVQECEFPEPLGEYVEVELDALEHALVWLERDLGAAFLAASLFFHLKLRNPTLVALYEELAVPADTDFEPFGERIYHGYAHTVQTARYLVGFVVKLAAGVKLGHDNLQRRHTLIGVQFCGNAAAVVDYLDDIARFDDHGDVAAVACKGLVYGVVDDLIDQMMKTDGSGGTDIHTRPFSDMLYAVEYLYVFSGITIHRVSPSQGLNSLFFNKLI